MSADETVTLPRGEYDALLDRTSELEDRLAAVEAEGDARLPHEVALAVIAGGSPVRAFRDHRGLSLRELSRRSGVSLSYLSEIERGRKPGSVAAMTRIAAALGVTIDSLVIGEQQD